MKHSSLILLVLAVCLLGGTGCGSDQPTQAAQQNNASPPLSEGRDLDEEDTTDQFVLEEVDVQGDVQNITWQELADVSFETKFYEELNESLLFPSFGQTVQDLNGKRVSIAGYVLPVSTQNDRYVLSANPFSSCFFCGGAGPESVVELELVSYGTQYFTDEFRTFSGILRLNDQNVDKLNYILEGAVEY